jgi:hypothetical protein
VVNLLADAAGLIIDPRVRARVGATP